MLAGGGLDHMGAQQRPALQIKRLMRLAVGQGLQTLLTGAVAEGAEVQPAHTQARVAVHLLARHAIDAGERGAQGFVAH